MYRALLAIVVLGVLSLSVGCKKSEIKPTNEAFTANKEAAEKGVQEAKTKMNQFMSPSMKANQGQ